jgi:hypothetical protein
MQQGFDLSPWVAGWRCRGGRRLDRDGEREGQDVAGVENHMTLTTLSEGERALKVKVEAVLAASGFIILPPGKNENKIT